MGLWVGPWGHQTLQCQPEMPWRVLVSLRAQLSPGARHWWDTSQEAHILVLRTSVQTAGASRAGK